MCTLAGSVVLMLSTSIHIKIYSSNWLYFWCHGLDVWTAFKNFCFPAHLTTSVANFHHTSVSSALHHKQSLPHSAKCFLPTHCQATQQTSMLFIQCANTFALKLVKRSTVWDIKVALASIFPLLENWKLVMLCKGSDCSAKQITWP